MNETEVGGMSKKTSLLPKKAAPTKTGRFVWFFLLAVAQISLRSLEADVYNDALHGSWKNNFHFFPVGWCYFFGFIIFTNMKASV